VQAKAHWVNRDTIGWSGAPSSDTYRLYYSPTGGITVESTTGVKGGEFIPLSVDPNGFPRSIVDKLPSLKTATALRISIADLAQVPALLKGQLVLVRFIGTQPADATSLQIPGVLDDLFGFFGELGARISDDTVPARDRGKYPAFTHVFSRGMQHLWSLADAGLTHVHLLPAFDFSSVPELRGLVQQAGLDLSDEQLRCGSATERGQQK